VNAYLVIISSSIHGESLGDEGEEEYVRSKERRDGCCCPLGRHRLIVQMWIRLNVLVLFMVCSRFKTFCYGS
jgi:hypothetical protein